VIQVKLAADRSRTRQPASLRLPGFFAAEAPMDALPDLPSLFAGARTDADSRGAAVLDHLLAGFEAHEADEARSIAAYRDLLEQVADPATRALVGIIVADEERHHALLGAMMRTLRASIAWQKLDDTLEGAPDAPEVRAALLERTTALIALERDGLRESRALAQRVGALYDGLFDALLDAIARDSAKHIALLEYLERHLRSTTPR
jgi:rubrerythrin